jgi:tight adherence protein C
MTPVAIGAACGLGVALGLLLVVDRAPATRKPRLEDRLAPYLRDEASASRLLTARDGTSSLPTVRRLVAPLVHDGVRRLEQVLGGSGSVRRRLERAGGHLTVEQLRVEQLAWGAVGLAGGVALSLVLAREVARREERMMLEFPTIAELLALAVTAGEGAAGALARVSATSRGELSAELRRALADTRAGASLVVALHDLADRTALPPLARFADGVAISVERGTPLAEVLRAQAVDVREAGRRALMEAGGRKEIAMMVPVVFLVLPVTVLFALFPGFIGFSLAG